MRLHELYSFPEERKDRNQNARSGGGVPAWCEGGQMPRARRLPKRGFKNPFRVTYEAINVGRLLEAFEGASEITIAAIYERGLAKKDAPVKILGDGEVKAAVTIEAHRFSKSAVEKISAAGGTAKALEG